MMQENMVIGDRPKESGSKYKQKKTLFLIIIFFLITIGVFGDCLAAEKNSAQRLKDVILIGWDGADREVVMEMLSSGQLANLQKLVNEGSLINIQVTTGETVTKPGWAEILTGYSAPSLEIYSNKNYKPIPKGYTIFERLKKFFGAKKIYTVFIGAKINNIGARGPHEICINCLPRDGITREKTSWWNKESCVAQTKDNKPYKWVHREGEPYYYSKKSIDLYSVALGPVCNVAQQAISILKRFRDKPFFAFFHFEEPDEQGHLYGRNSIQYREAIKTTDHWLGVIMDKLKTLGIYDRVTIYLTADHGFDNEGFEHFNAPCIFLATSSKEKLKNGDRKDITPTILDEYGINPNTISQPLDGETLFTDNKKIDRKN